MTTKTVSPYRKSRHAIWAAHQGGDFAALGAGLRAELLLLGLRHPRRLLAAKARGPSARKGSSTQCMCDSRQCLPGDSPSRIMAEGMEKHAGGQSCKAQGRHGPPQAGDSARRPLTRSSLVSAARTIVTRWRELRACTPISAGRPFRVLQVQDSAMWGAPQLAPAVWGAPQIAPGDPGLFGAHPN